MRSATSYFNGTLYRKTLARFWPLWGLYGVLWMFFIPLHMLSGYFSRYTSIDPLQRLITQATNLHSYATPGLYFAAFFAILCAMAVFGYLYNHRSACWTHALPTRREALFTTQYLAGLSFLLLPQLAVAVLTAAIELAFLPVFHWRDALGALLAWLLAQSGTCLFFFSFAAFCAMFTGHILALPAFYCILNVLADAIYSLLDGLFRAFFFGYAGSPGIYRVVEYLTPGIALKDALEPFGAYDAFRSSGTVAAYAGVGVLLALASLYVYRRRHVETAGDVVAVSLVRPLFKYGVSFCSGLCFGMFTAVFFDIFGLASLTVCILVWSVVGYFAAEMLLKKSFRVWKAWKGAAAMSAVMLLLCAACFLDLFGVSARVPGPDQVERLAVSMAMGSPRDDGSYFCTTLTDPSDIQRFIALHQAIVDDRDRLNGESQHYQSGNDYSRLQLIYTLKGGSTLERDYHSIPVYQEDLDREGSVTNLFQGLLADRALVERAYGFEDFLKDGRLTGAWLDRLYDDRDELSYNVYVDDYAKQLWDAVQADFDEGTIGVRYLFDIDSERLSNTCHTDLTFSVSGYHTPDDSDQEGYSVQVTPSGAKMDRTLTITLTPNARHTLAVLDQTGLWEEGYSLAFRGVPYG